MGRKKCWSLKKNIKFFGDPFLEDFWGSFRPSRPQIPLEIYRPRIFRNWRGLDWPITSEIENWRILKDRSLVFRAFCSRSDPLRFASAPDLCKASSRWGQRIGHITSHFSIFDRITASLASKSCPRSASQDFCSLRKKRHLSFKIKLFRKMGREKFQTSSKKL